MEFLVVAILFAAAVVTVVYAMNQPARPDQGIGATTTGPGVEPTPDPVTLLADAFARREARRGTPDEKALADLDGLWDALFEDAVRDGLERSAPGRLATTTD